MSKHRDHSKRKRRRDEDSESSSTSSDHHRHGSSRRKDRRKRRRHHEDDSSSAATSTDSRRGQRHSKKPDRHPRNRHAEDRKRAGRRREEEQEDGDASCRPPPPPSSSSGGGGGLLTHSALAQPSHGRESSAKFHQWVREQAEAEAATEERQGRVRRITERHLADFLDRVSRQKVKALIDAVYGCCTVPEEHNVVIDAVLMKMREDSREANWDTKRLLLDLYAFDGLAKAAFQSKDDRVLAVYLNRFQEVVQDAVPWKLAKMNRLRSPEEMDTDRLLGPFFRVFKTWRVFLRPADQELLENAKRLALLE